MKKTKYSYIHFSNEEEKELYYCVLSWCQSIRCNFPARIRFETLFKKEINNGNRDMFLIEELFLECFCIEYKIDKKNRDAIYTIKRALSGFNIYAWMFYQYKKDLDFEDEIYQYKIKRNEMVKYEKEREKEKEQGKGK